MIRERVMKGIEALGDKEELTQDCIESGEELTQDWIKICDGVNSGPDEKYG